MNKIFWSKAIYFLIVATWLSVVIVYPNIHNESVIGGLYLMLLIAGIVTRRNKKESYFLILLAALLPILELLWSLICGNGSINENKEYLIFGIMGMYSYFIFAIIIPGYFTSVIIYSKLLDHYNEK